MASRSRGAVMKRSRFTDEKIVRIFQEADKDPVAEVAKRHGVSEPSIYAWREKVGGLGTDDVKRFNSSSKRTVGSRNWLLSPISRSS
jgi:transposase-like protein